MKEKHDNNTSLGLWNQFIAGTNSDAIGKRVGKTIYDSWVRSREAGVDPLMSKLPERLIDEARAEYAFNWQFKTSIFLPYIQQLSPFMDEYQVALLYLNKNLYVIAQNGPKNFLKNLISRNFGVGTCFREEVVGTNAAALSLAQNKPAIVSGYNHYCSVLHDLSCIAYPYHSSENNDYRTMMFVTNVKNFNPLMRDLLVHYAQLLNISHSLTASRTELYMAYEQLGSIMSKRFQGSIFVDNRGSIRWINDYAKEILALDDALPLGKTLSDAFPELKVALNCLETGERVSMREITINRNGKNIHTSMEVNTLRKNDDIIGIIVTLYQAKRFHGRRSNSSEFAARYSFDEMVGKSEQFSTVKNVAEITALGDSNTLITGESGTGKELFAQAIHNGGERAHGPFVSINCAALPKELIGSELFGYVEGAFSGARKGGAPGKFELAKGGTLFLDEIGEMPLDMQAVLLRVLEERVITRIGGQKQIPIDIKLIAATNQDLTHAIAEKRFRLDLYYRLNVIRINIPPLRSRPTDIPVYAKYFLQEFNDKMNRGLEGFSQEAEALLVNYAWPGNVRELRNVIEQIVSVNAPGTNSGLVQSDMLPREIFEHSLDSTAVPNGKINIHDLLSRRYDKKAVEMYRIARLMEEHGGNKTVVALKLGISRPTLYRRLVEMQAAGQLQL